MSVSRRIVARLLSCTVAVSALTVGLIVEPPVATASIRHRTLNDTQPVGVAPVRPGHTIDFFGLVADLDSPTGSLAPQGATPYGEARFLVDDSWTEWQKLDKDGAQSEGQFTGSLIAVDGATAYQVRNLPDGAHNWRAAAINTTDGPVEVTTRRGPAKAHAAEAVQCRSRADWGADESIPTWSETNQRLFSPVQVITVHHTSGSNDPTQDFSATVRAILSYHVQSNGWSDIGYQYLIDRQGIVYEGRDANGYTSRSCLTGGGDGSDFAHQTGTDNLVTGAHVGGYNSGNLGISVMGCYEDAACTGDTAVPKAATNSLTSLLAKLAKRHSLDPQGTVNYVSPSNPDATKDSVDTISAHLDWSDTDCPGANLLAQLPAIRANVAAAMTAEEDTDGLVSLAPARLLDTRAGESTVDGSFSGKGRLGAGASLTVTVSGRGGVPSSGVAAVVLNVTGVQASSGTYLTAYPSGETVPHASNLNLTAGQTAANLSVVKLGTGGQISVYNAGGLVDVVLDVAGYYPTGTSFNALSPVRLLDTRTGETTVDGTFAGSGPVSAGGVLDLQVTDRSGIPASGVAAVVLNVTGIASASTYVTVHPTGSDLPNASSLNLVPSDPTPNLVVVKVGENGMVRLYNAAGSTQLIADVAGWIPEETTYTPIVPVRLLETRSGPGLTTVDGQSQGTGRVGAGSTITVPITGRAGIPDNATAVFVNVTAVQATANTYLTVFPAGTSRPNASNLNLASGQTRPNLVLAMIDANGAISVFNASGTVDLILDVVGYVVPSE